MLVFRKNIGDIKPIKTYRSNVPLFVQYLYRYEAVDTVEFGRLKVSKRGICFVDILFSITLYLRNKKKVLS